MYLYQNNKACENLLLYIFKHVISRKKLSTTLVVFVVKRSKNYNAVVSRQNIRIRLSLFLLFDVNFFSVLFCFCVTNFDVFTIFSELSGLKRNVPYMEIYIPMKRSILSLTKYAIFM